MVLFFEKRSESCKRPRRRGHQGTHGFLAAVDGETGKEITGWNLATVRVQERAEGSGDAEHKNIH